MRITKIGFSNCAGLVRSAAAPHVRGEWVAFLDDDDTVFSNYVQALVEAPQADLIVFRMVMGNRIVPHPACRNASQLRGGDVGISFSVKSDIFKSILMRPSEYEDYTFIDNVRKTHTVRVSDAVTYNVRPSH